MQDVAALAPWVGMVGFVGTVGVGLWRIAARTAANEERHHARMDSVERALADSILASRQRHDRTEAALSSMASSIERLATAIADRSERTSASLASIDAKLSAHHDQIERLQAIRP